MKSLFLSLSLMLGFCVPAFAASNNDVIQLSSHEKLSIRHDCKSGKPCAEDVIVLPKTAAMTLELLGIYFSKSQPAYHIKAPAVIGTMPCSYYIFNPSKFPQHVFFPTSTGHWTLLTVGADGLSVYTKTPL